jgi:AhpD family alkylhydroperoxidase
MMMSRISRLDRTQVTPDLAALFDKVFALRGNVPNMFRVMAHRPEIFATMQAHFGAVLNTGTVSTRLKELIIVRTSQVNDTPYCLASHTILARNLGWTDDQLAHLADWSTREDFTPAEKVALRLAETVTRDAHAVTDEQFSERDRRVALRHWLVQLLQPLQQRAADAAHPARRRLLYVCTGRGIHREIDAATREHCYRSLIFSRSTSFA